MGRLMTHLFRETFLYQDVTITMHLHTAIMTVALNFDSFVSLRQTEVCGLICR